MTTTALVPLSACDTQVMDVIRQLNQGTKSKDTIHDRAMRSIRATIKNICIEGALSVLNAFGYKFDEFHLDGNKWVISDLADEHYFPDCQGRMANETPVFLFWGGPPTRLKWYKGTLQTLLEDRLLYEVITRGAEDVACWIGTDLDAVENVDVGC